MYNLNFLVVKEMRIPTRLAMETCHLSGVERAELPQKLRSLMIGSLPVRLGDGLARFPPTVSEAPARRPGNAFRPESTPARFSGRGQRSFPW